MFAATSVRATHDSLNSRARTLMLVLQNNAEPSFELAFMVLQAGPSALLTACQRRSQGRCRAQCCFGSSIRNFPSAGSYSPAGSGPPDFTMPHHLQTES